MNESGCGCRLSEADEAEQAHPFYPFMLHALELSQAGRGRTAPNPCVGAVLVRNGQIVAEGWHHKYGGDHAEIEALKDAASKGVNPADCSMAVTLEPCAHHGKTPPCVDALLQAGIRHVVIGCPDPNPVAAGGAARLAAAGVKVESGVALSACRDNISDFLHWQNTPYPYTILKLASTLDGRIATRTGNSQWITSPKTRSAVHELRSYAQAVIIGGNTFYKDNPKLTFRPELLTDEAKARCMPDGEASVRQPLAVVVTSRLPMADSSYHILRDRPEKAVFWTTAATSASPRAKAMREAGVKVYGLPSYPRIDASGRGMRSELNLEDGFAQLREEFNCHYVICEGGGKLGMSLLRKGLAQEFHLHLGPKIFGDNEATPLFDGLSPTQIEEALSLRIVGTQISDCDLMIRLRPNQPSGGGK